MDETTSFLGYGHETRPTDDLEPFDPYTLMAKSPNAEEKKIDTADRAQTHRLNFRVVLSAIIVFSGTAGLATALLIWLAIHTIQPTFADVWNDGAFLLNEGERTEGSLRSGRLLGSSAAVSAIRLCVTGKGCLYYLGYRPIPHNASAHGAIRIPDCSGLA